MYFLRWIESQGDLSSALTIAGVLRTDLLGPIYCTASNSLEKATSAPFNLTVYCKYCAAGNSSHTGNDVLGLNRRASWLA